MKKYWQITMAFFFVFENFHHLAVGHVRATDNTQDGKNGHEYPFRTQPFIEVQADEKAKYDAAGHRQSELHHNGQVFCPCTVLFVVEIHRKSTPWPGGRILPNLGTKNF